jgi:alpha-galactosidase/6-phospho-beta-glucosidase family protein
MAPRIVIIGGGSVQWVPKLLRDIANTPSLHGSEVVIEDIDGASVPRMVGLAEHIAGIRGIPLTVTGTTDQRVALAGADFVVVAISTGGFASMRHDLAIPARFGVRQTIGDTVGPGGIARALRNIPVLVDIARDMEALCPDAWLLNVTNPMTTLCRAITGQSSIKAVGLCHEITITQLLLSLLLDTSYFDVDMTVAGVNHLPIITELRLAGADGFADLTELLGGGDLLDQPLAMELPDGVLHGAPRGDKWTKRDIVDHSQIKLDVFRRFGVLPGAGDRHVAEFFAGYLTEESAWGEHWGVQLVPIEVHEGSQVDHLADFARDLASDHVSEWPSGELVAPLIDSLITGTPRVMPLNIPNDGSVADLPDGVVVEMMCVADRDGVRGRDQVSLPPFLAEHLRRISLRRSSPCRRRCRGGGHWSSMPCRRIPWPAAWTRVDSTRWPTSSSGRRRLGCPGSLRRCRILP